MQTEPYPKRATADLYPPLSSPLRIDVVGLIRCALGLSALLVVVLDPPATARFPALTYTATALYVLYSTLLYLSHRLGRAPSFWRRAYWVDVGWYVLIISLSDGANSVFVVCFLFPCLVASFTDGFRAGFSVSLVAAGLLTAVWLAALPSASDSEIGRFLMRLVIMVMLGYMLAHWGGSEMKSKARLALLRDINEFSNPRFGIDRTLGYAVDKIRTGLNADRCLLVTADPKAATYNLRTSSPQAANAGAAAESIPESFAALLLSPPEGAAFVYRGRAGAFRQAWRRMIGTPEDGEGREGDAVEELANIFDAKSFLTVPVRSGNGPDGRFYLVSNRPRAFDEADTAFVAQTLNHVIPVIENVRLVDQLASTAAEHERQKIARDIHDSVIQPYIGLRIGLSAVRHKLDAGADVSADVDKLIELAEGEINDLRSYMRGLKGEQAQRDNLLPAIQRFTAKFSEAAQIDVRLEALGDLRVNDRLAAEIFQIVAEGLSNIRRHTTAKRASVSLEVRDDHLHMEVVNEDWPDAPAAHFTPRSISERVESLGGRLAVKREAGGGAALKIEIPL